MMLINGRNLDRIELGAVIVGVGVAGYLIYRAVAGIGSAASAAAGAVHDAAANFGPTAPFVDGFNPDEWRPAGWYIGDVLMFHTGGFERRPGVAKASGIVPSSALLGGMSGYGEGSGS